MGIFPLTSACLRLIGMLLVENHEDWLTGERAYLRFDDASDDDSTAKVVTIGGGPMRKEAFVNARPLTVRDLSLSH